ncbi:MAG: phage tail tape measure protein, partial [Planctomycetota bacterium]
FSEALTNKAGAALKIVGKDIEEGVAVLAAFADQGLKGAEAGTALNIVMRDMQTKALQNTRAFKQFNVSVFDAYGKMRNMADILRDIELALIGLSDAIRQYETALKSAADTTVEVADKQLTPFQKGWAELSGTFGELAQDVQLVTDALGKLMEVGAEWWPNLRGMPTKDQVGAIKNWYTDIADDIARAIAFLGGAEGPADFSRDILRDSEAVEARLLQELAERTKKTQELAEATEDVAKATRKITVSPELAKIDAIMESLATQVQATNLNALGRAFDRLRALGATPNQLRLAADSIDAIQRAQGSRELDALIDGLQRERDALIHTARELDLLEAGLIDAAREQAKLDRQAKAEAARHAKRSDRITSFVEVDLSRSIVSGLTMARKQKQKVRDDDAVLLLQRIERNTQPSGVAIVAPG